MKKTSQALSNNVNTLNELKDALMNPENTALALQTRIENPAKEVELALTQYLTSKLDHLSKNDEFEDLIKLHIRSRINEASFEELINLMNMLTKNNNEATRGIVSLFKNDTSGKIITEHLRDTNMGAVAQEVYDSTESKDILQAVSYLSQVLGKMKVTNTVKVDTN